MLVAWRNPIGTVGRPRYIQGAGFASPNAASVDDHRRTRHVTRSAGHGTLGWRKSTSERANGAFEAAKMISHRRFITTASPLPERSCLPVCVASGRPSKTAVAAWEMECAMLDHGEGRGMLPDSKQPSVRPESWRPLTTVTRTTFQNQDQVK